MQGTLTKLVKGCIAGDRSSQSQLYELFAAKMMVVSMRYARSRQDAEDIMQEGFIKVFRSLAGFQGTGSLEGWIRKIIVNTSIEHYRNRIHINPVVDIETVSSQAFAATIEADMNAKDLLMLVQTLPTSCRMVFNLYVFEGYKHKEIAVMLGISEGTSKSNLYDARTLLQKRVQTASLVKRKSV